MAFSLIHNATLIDGRGGHPVPKAAVLVEDNRIRAVGPAAQVKRPAGDVTEIDAQGGWILPGLIDTHVHIMLEGVNIARDLQTPFSLRFYNAVTYLRRTLEAGVTSVRDAGGADLGTKTAVEKGVVAGPRTADQRLRADHHRRPRRRLDAVRRRVRALPALSRLAGRARRRRGGGAQEGARGAARRRGGGKDLRHGRRAQPHRPPGVHPVFAGGAGRDRARGGLSPRRQGHGARAGAGGHQERGARRHPLHRARHLPGRRGRST